jgi:glycogen synthase
MHVLQLGPYPPPYGGVQANLVAIREYLRDHGIPCSVINLTSHREPPHDDIYFPNGPVEVVRLMFKLRPTILHLHIGGDITLRLALLGLMCASVPGGHAVLTLHSGGYPASPAGQAATPRSLRGFVFRRFSRLIGVNAELGKLFLRFGVPPDRILVIAPHALPAAPPEVDFPPLLEQFFQKHDPVLISMGWLEPEYNYALQIDSLGAIRETHPRSGLVIMGAGRLQQPLESQIAATSYATDVLLAGDVPHDIALRAIARSHVFLRTTDYDGDSVSVREALHFETPVVASDNGMRPDGVILLRALDRQAVRDGVEIALARPKPTRKLEADWSNVETVVEMYREIEMASR